MEHAYVASSIGDDVRVDGRTRLASRDFALRLNINPQARGSAQVWLGETAVVCFVYSDVTDRDDLGAAHGIAVVARVVSVSDDVDAAAARTLQADLALMFRGAGEGAAAQGVAARLFGGAGERAGVCVQVTCEISVLSGAGGNVLGAASVAAKSALFCAALPRMSVTAAADGGAASVEVDELRREPIAALGVAAPLAVKAVTTAAAFYCVDPCREEEAAAAFECVVAAQPRGAAENGANRGAGATEVVYSRVHGCATGALRQRDGDSSASTARLSVADVTTLVAELVAVAERQQEAWATKLIATA
jgi:exosome complex RNA-binding protein Rrp42 (RNase PH superfamily)